MRKAQKDQAKDFVKLLDQVHNQIKKSIEKHDIQNAQALLQDCQEGAIALGTMIEKYEGKDFVTIPLLEEYCELAYHIHESLALGEDDSKNKAYKRLKKQLIKISNSVINDIAIRKEVVFVPYKASMWDSLESVWRAADADPDCDAYVIPIPYYDKNPDGSFREVHYEGAEYPKDVPITHYDDYDFAGRHPDMIFCHNPYDEYNHVTSVHPFFYTKNLKKYTDKLVYIPYFVLQEISPDDESAVKGMEHFCTVPAVVYTDNVIVQSEDMRQIYINVLTKTYGEESRGIWEKKILGLGSPKIDKVLGTRKEDLEIPEEWLNIIQKPDGSFKKIVFYNTSISALLRHNEKMLEKMKYVFGVFKENRTELALLWRPHPLIKAAIESMRPELWKQYKKLVEEYRQEGWGIYDDTADLDRAVILSDAYYGDCSSVVWLYKEIRKAIMIQNVNIRQYDNTRKQS